MDSEDFIRRHGKSFDCEMCGTRLASGQCVTDHIKGKKHRRLVNLKLTREEQSERSIFVGNLRKTNSEVELTDHFSKFGPLSRVIIDKQKSAYAIVEFAEHRSAMKATEEEKQLMNGLHIVVRPREAREFVSSGIRQRNAALEDRKKKAEDQRREMEHVAAKLAENETIEEQMLTLVKSTCLSSSSVQLRYLICHLLQEVFSEFFPTGCIFPYGSSVNGCGREGADLDIFLSLNWKDEGWKYGFASLGEDEIQGTSQDKTSTTMDQSSASDDSRMDEGILDSEQASEEDTLEFVAQVLQKCVPSCHRVQLIASARKPVVKFVHKESGLHCDIVLNNRLSLRNTELIKFYCTLHPVVRPLIFFLRRWGKLHHVAENIGPGPRLTNYALTWMVIFFLQTERIVPTVEELMQRAGPHELLKIEGWDCSLCLDNSQFLHQQETVNSGNLLVAFFDYYAKIDWSTNCLSPATGKLLSVNQVVKVTHPSSDGHFKVGPINIQDPLELTHNTAANVNEKTAKILSQECMTSSTTCKSVKFGKKTADMTGDGKASPPWGIALLMHSQPKEQTAKKIEGKEIYRLSFHFEGQRLTDDFVKVHNDPKTQISVWAQNVKSLLLEVLKHTLQVSVSRMVAESHNVLSGEHPGENLATSMEVDGEVQDEPPKKRQRTTVSSSSEEDMEANPREGRESTGEGDGSLTYSCKLFHEVWVGRRKIRRQLQQSGNTSTGLDLEKMVTEKLIQEAGDDKKDEALMEFHLDYTSEDKEGIATVHLNMLPLKGETSFKLFFHYLENFLPKLVSEHRF